ncbi:hypothetical protein GCM10008967_28750 [Bacillus carboniphilus]|uniref:Uncharacterized protein n=1 Tax=Bacillus carboniphilus TaxID=86663 RepID=A0ABP3G6X8_9BACI
MTLFMRLIVIIIVSFVLVGCEEDEFLTEDIKKLIIQISNLKNELEKKNAEIVEMSNNLDQVTERNRLLEHEVDQLSIQNEAIHVFNVFKEKLFVASDVVSYETLTITKVKELLGEPTEVTETTAYEGIDITLTYNDITLIFREVNEIKVIRAIIIKDSFFTTSKGITIGSSKEEVKSVYGKFIQEEYDNFISLGGKTGMSFEFVDDRVSEIFIWFQYE